MAIVPLLFRDWWDDMDFPITSRLLDQNFGTALNRNDLLSTVWGGHPARYRSGYRRPWTHALNSLLKQDDGSTVHVDKDKFEVILDVQQFAPNEVNVKVVDKYIVVEGKHEEKQDEHGFISRHFSRRYLLPEGVNQEAVTSQLSSDGVFTVRAPMKALPAPAEERAIPITHTKQPAKNSEPKKLENKL
uniref:Heat shock protein Hsp20 n=1 Tax=Liriomyza huidobrensis TaxID=127405 RepID=Q1PCB7_LIRHU|nr:heat shock protein Hsp20 [Liriomyza huidobrensis]